MFIFNRNLFKQTYENDWKLKMYVMLMYFISTFVLFFIMVCFIRIFFDLGFLKDINNYKVEEKLMIKNTRTKRNYDKDEKSEGNPNLS